MRALLREPLLHFFAAAALILGAHALYQSHFQTVIRVDKTAIDDLILADRFEQKRETSAAEQRQLLRRHIENEVLYREALKRDMLASQAVKTLLIQQLRTQLEPVIAEPTEAQLRELYNKTAQQYQLPSQLSFVHVSYSREEGVPEGLLSKLQGGDTPSQYGESIRLANPLPLTYQTQLKRILGEEASTEIFNHALGEWFGPIRSQRGIHFIYILEKVGAQTMPFNVVRNTLKANWINAQKRKQVDAELAEIMARYRIVVPDDYQDVLL